MKQYPLFAAGLKHLAVAVALLAPALVAAQQDVAQGLVGHFTMLETDLPGCGVWAGGANGTFVIDSDGRVLDVVIPCIETNFAHLASGKFSPLEINTRYRTRVADVRPEGLDTPAATPGLLYLVDAREAEAMAP